MAQDGLRQNLAMDERRRLLRNLAEVSTLAGQLAADDLGNTISGRAYYALALDAAQEVADEQLTAIAHGHTAQLVAAEGFTTTALGHLITGSEHARCTPALASWLASIKATIHADRGEHTAAREALDRAHTVVGQVGGRAVPASFRHPGTSQLSAVSGRLLFRAGDYAGACERLIATLDQSHPIPRRQRVLVLIDLATAELRSGDLPAACSHATQAAALLCHAAYAVGATRLRAFRAAAQRPLNNGALRALDEHLTRIAA
jgi:tetratricopeptide (TPR) repeat protein